jgi:hypothetical protein
MRKELPVNRLTASVVCGVLLTVAGCCPKKPAEPAESKPAPVAPADSKPAPPVVSSGDANASAPDPAAAPPRRILGLDEGWELAPAGATYMATQSKGEVTVKATGEHRTGGYETKLVMSPLRIYPPQWMLAVKKPDGPAAQVITPFEAAASFKAGEPVKAIHVSDAGGKHEVIVQQAGE